MLVIYDCMADCNWYQESETWTTKLFLIICVFFLWPDFQYKNRETKKPDDEAN